MYFQTAAKSNPTDVLLHDQFPREPQPDLYQQVRGVVVGRLTGCWTLADRHGRAIYGHC